MSEDSTTRDYMERTRELWEAASRGEFPLDME